MNSLSTNPYVGPRTFSKEEKHLFFGREREARDLRALVISEQFVLFYAQSGAGKSSLINTRLVPDLEQKDFEVLPVSRVSGDAPSGVEVDNIYVYNLMHNLLQCEVDPHLLANLPLSKFLDLLSRNEAGLFCYDETTADADVPENNALLRRALIIDQFEELFSMHPEAWRKREDFFCQLADAMRADPYLWIVLVMREDYIASMDPYAHLLPGGLRTRYYMQRLEHDAALEAIKSPVAKLRPYAEGVAEKLVDDLSRIKMQKMDAREDAPTEEYELGQYIEPVQLQVVCYNLWQELMRTDPLGSNITEKDLQGLGDVDQTLGKYYAERVKGVAQEKHVKESIIRNWFEKTLITPDRNRNIVTHSANLGLDLDVIQALHSDLVRSERRGGVIVYELTHDRLVEPIIADNKTWFEENSSLLQRQAKLWSDQGRPDSLLLRDEALSEAAQWAKENEDELIESERDLLRASQEQQDQLEKQKTIERMKLEQAEEQARSAARARRLTRIALSALVGVLIIGAFAVSESLKATRNAKLLATKEAEANAAAAEAKELANAAVSRELAGQSADNLDKQLDLSILLGLEAFNKNIEDPKVEIIPQVENALFNNMQRSLRLRGFLATSNDPASKFQYSPDGKFVAVLREDGIMLWDVSKNQARGTVPNSKFATQFFFSPNGPDGPKLIYLDHAGITFWDIQNFKSSNPVPLNGHKGTVTNVVFSAGGEQFATVGENGEVTLWDARQKSLNLKLDGITAHAFSPDNTKLAVLDRDGKITIYGMSDARQQGAPIEMEPGTVTAMAFNQAGDTLVIGDENGNITLWDLNADKQVKSFGSGNASIYSLYFSADGKFILYETMEGIKTWSLDKNAPSGNAVASNGEVIFSPNGKVFAQVGSGGKIYLHDALTSKSNTPIDGTLCAFSLDGNILAVFNEADKSLKLFDSASGEQIGDAFPEQTDVAVAMAFSKDGNSLAVVAPNGSIKVWDVPSRGPKLSNTAEKTPVGSLSFDPGGNLLVVGREDGSLMLWNQTDKTTKPLQTGYQGRINSISLSLSGRYVYSTARDGTTLIDMETLKAVGGVFPGSNIIFSQAENLLVSVDSSTETGECSLWSLPSARKIKGNIPCYDAMFSPHGAKVAIKTYTDETKSTVATTLWDSSSGSQIGGSNNGYPIAFSPDDQSLALEGDTALPAPTITILNTSTGKPVAEPISGNNVYFSPKGNAVVITDYTPNLTVMDRSTGKVLRETSSSGYIGFSPDGTMLVLQNYSSEGGVIFWDIEKAEQIGDPILNVTFTMFSPDGRRLAIGTYSNITVWDTMTRKQIGNLPRSGNAQFSPDGSYLVSSDYYGGTTVWNISTDEQISLSGNETFDPGTSPFSRDGKYLLLYDTSAYAYTFWDVATGKQVGGRLAGHAGWICGGLLNQSGDRQIDFQNNANNYCNPNSGVSDLSGNAFLLSPDEQTYAAFSLADGTVSLWTVESPPSIPGDEIPDIEQNISNAQLSQDGHTLALSTQDSMLLWDTQKGSQIGQLDNVHVKQPYSVYLSANGKALAVAYGDGSLSLWNAEKGEQIGKPIQESFSGFSPDGKILLTSPSYQAFTLWDAATGRKIGQLSSADNFQFTRDGRYLVLYSYYSAGNIRIVDASTGTQVGDPVEGSLIGTGPDATILTRNGTSILLQDIDKDMKTRSYNIHDDGNSYFQLSSDGKYLAQISDGPFIMWDLATGKRIGEIDEHPGDFQGFSPDGQFVYFYDYSEGGLTLYQAAYPNKRILDDPITGNTLFFSPDGRYFGAYYSYYYNPQITLFDASTGDQLDQIDVDGTLQGFGNDGRLLVTMKDWKNVYIWSTEDFTKEPAAVDYPGVLTSTVLSEDGSTLALYGNAGVVVMSLTDAARSTKPIQEKTSIVQQMVFSPDGNTLATIGTDGLVLWDVKSQLQIGETITSTDSYITNVKFSPDGKNVIYLDSARDVFKVDLGNNIGAKDNSPILSGSCAVAFNSQGNLLSVKQNGRKLQILNTNTNQLTDLELDGSCDNPMAFSPDGASFAYNGGDRISIFVADQDKPFALPRGFIGDQSSYSNLNFVLGAKMLAMQGSDGRVYVWDIESRSLVFASAEAANLQTVLDGKIMFFLPSENHLVSLDFAPLALRGSFYKWKEVLCAKAGRNFLTTEWQQYFLEEDYRRTCLQYPPGD